MNNATIQIAEVIFAGVGAIATVGGLVWGGARMIRRVKQKTGGYYSPAIQGDKNIVMNISNGSDLQELRKLLDASKTAVQVPDASPKIKEFRRAIEDEKVTKLLIQAAEIAKDLGRDADLVWIQNELLGYGKHQADDIPKYRTIQAKFHVQFPDELMTLPMPLRWAESVPELEKMADSTAARYSTELPIQDWMRKGAGARVFEGRNSFPVVIEASDIERVVRRVRRRLREFLLSLRKCLHESGKKQMESATLK